MRRRDEFPHGQTGEGGFADEGLLLNYVFLDGANELASGRDLRLGGIMRVQRRSNGIRAEVRHSELIGILLRKGCFARTIRTAYDQESRGISQSAFQSLVRVGEATERLS